MSRAAKLMDHYTHVRAYARGFRDVIIRLCDRLRLALMDRESLSIRYTDLIAREQVRNIEDSDTEGT